MVGYVSINPKRVHKVVDALRDSGRAAREIQRNLEREVERARDLGVRFTFMAPAGVTSYDDAQKDPQQNPLPRLWHEAFVHAGSHERRVERFERMTERAEKGLPTDPPQTWFNDQGAKKEEDIDKALKAFRGVRGAEPGERFTKINKVLEDLNKNEARAVLRKFDDDQLRQILAAAEDAPDGPAKQEFLDQLSRVSMGTVRDRLIGLSPMFAAHVAPPVMSTPEPPPPPV